MKAAVLKNNKFIIEDIEKPSLEKYGKGAIIKVTGCGLCGSDIVKIRTGIAKENSVLGHEAVGIIEEINVESKFMVGDKIVLGHHVPCFNCQYCWNESYSMCKHFKETNIFPGGFAEYIFASEEHLNNTAFKVSEVLNEVEASYMEPLACCLRAVKRARLKDNTKSLILGLGSVGLLMGQAVKSMGNKAYGCDLLSERVRLSEKYGFEKSFIFENEEKTVQNMKETAPLGFDCVFLTAGADKTLDFAVKTVRDGGEIVVFSSIKNENGFKNNDIYYREITVTGSYSPSPSDLEDSINLIESKKVNVSGLSTDYPLENLNEAISDTLSNKIMKAYIRI